MKNKSELTTEISKQGLGEQSWWVEQWMELINSYRYKKRLERAWGYAREGNPTFGVASSYDRDISLTWNRSIKWWWLLIGGGLLLGLLSKMKDTR